ncbi:MAG: hypothetical protein Q7T17_12435 [Microbacterium sp.]|uniref:hypothetical protein n=1 Tax=Microbacterium sp. TaxID=51671 RepID=UPI002716B900|nr:hypothetical protein [Microbacterium sp.]MDO8383769.1 hypothetical protein [Microbacterium sp.]
MSTTAPEPAVSLGLEHYLFVVRRQWRVVVAAVVVGVVAGFVFLAIVPREYTATTIVNLNVITTDPFNPQRPASGLLDDATEADIAGSQVVAQIAADAAPSMTATEIRRGSSVELTSETTIARVSFTATDPAVAAEMAQAVATAYLQFRSQQAEERIDVTVENLSGRIDALNARLAEVNGVIAGDPDNGAAIAQATTERDQILIELEGLVSSRNSLQSVDTTGGTVLTAASENDLMEAPNQPLVIATGAAIGLVLGIVLAFVVNPFMTTLRNRKEIVRSTGRPVLARLRSASPSVPATGVDADALRVARERILAETRSGTARILVLDATHSGDVTAAVMDLGVVTAQSQRQTLVIAPEARQAQREVWRSALGVDLTQSPAGTVVSAQRVPGLSVYAAGAGIDADADSDVLVGRDVRRALQDATAGSICYLALTAEAHPASLLAALRESDAAVIVLRSGTSRTTDVRDFLSEAQNLDTPLLGSIVLPKLRGEKVPLVPRASETELPEFASSTSSFGDDGDDDDLEEGTDALSSPSSTTRKPPRRRATPRPAVDATSSSPGHEL